MDKVMVERSNETARRSWFLAYTRPRMEDTALRNLERQGFEAYLPLYKTIRRTSAGMQAAFEPLFPRYLFFRPSRPEQSLSTVRSTQGVTCLVSFGGEAARIDEATLMHIRSLERSRNEADLDSISPIQLGARVRMHHAGLQGLEGLVVAVAKHRVTFLLQLLGRERRVTVERQDLELA